jgi:Flp pilus assembly protein TadD
LRTIRIAPRAVFFSCALSAAALASGALRADQFPYIADPVGPYFYLGDEDTRVGRAHFIRGQYGLAEVHFRRAVEATPRNGAAWVGLAASYDRIGRFDLADRAYRQAERIAGRNYVVLNNRGYSYLLRGRPREAGRLLYRAAELAPGDPTIANNINILQTGQAYFWGAQPYIWGWPP